MLHPAAAMNGQILAAEQLVKRFSGLSAVDGVSLGLAKGEIVGLIGPNGAGKSTLFDLLGGNERPTSGRILMGGRAVTRLPPHRRAALGLARTFQIPRPFAAMTVVENTMLGRQHQSGERILPNFGLPGRVGAEERATFESAMRLLDFMGLAQHAASPARILSGGQRKLLELARVLMAAPTVILLDEPAAGVNPSLLALLVERIETLNRQGLTFLIVEHNMDVVARLCRRVIVMAGGRLLCEGTPAEVTRDQRLIDAYLGGPPE